MPRLYGAAKPRPEVETEIRTPEDALASLYGLTKAEARLAAALLSGRQLQEYADARGITRNTAATQLKHLMAKLGAKRQSDVVRILAMGPGALRIDPGK